jgi:3-hydroxyisobutyrate dehydrogenase
MLKDLGLAQGAAGKEPVPMGRMAQRLYEAMVAQGMGGLDFGGILKLMEENPELVKGIGK